MTKRAGEYLRASRKRLEMHQKDAAKALSLSASFISDVERGYREIPRLKFKRFAEVYDIESVDYLYFLAGKLPMDIAGMNLSELTVSSMFNIMRSQGGVGK